MVLEKPQQTEAGELVHSEPKSSGQDNAVRKLEDALKTTFNCKSDKRLVPIIWYNVDRVRLSARTNVRALFYSETFNLYYNLTMMEIIIKIILWLAIWFLVWLAFYFLSYRKMNLYRKVSADSRIFLF